MQQSDCEGDLFGSGRGFGVINHMVLISDGSPLGLRNVHVIQFGSHCCLKEPTQRFASPGWVHVRRKLLKLSKDDPQKMRGGAACLLNVHFMVRLTDDTIELIQLYMTVHVTAVSFSYPLKWFIEMLSQVLQDKSGSFWLISHLNVAFLWFPLQWTGLQRPER